MIYYLYSADQFKAKSDNNDRSSSLHTSINAKGSTLLWSLLA